jgi:hypothetical protein
MNRSIGVTMISAVFSIALFSIPTFAAQKADIEKYCAMVHSKDNNERAVAVAELVKIGRPAGRAF